MKLPDSPSLAVTAVTLVMALSQGCGDDTPAPAVNGCAAADFVDRSAASAARTVGFGGAEGSGPLAYSPRCITVAAGQAVTFTGSGASAFGGHPLSPGTASAGSTPPNPRGGSPGNPIPRTTDGMSITVTFPAAGTYPYYCELHEPGMAGVVVVR